VTATAERTALSDPVPVTSARRGRPLRSALLVPAGLSMLAGLDAALMLLGVPAPLSTDRLPDVHGVLMVLGFVGTLVSLERAVALGRPGGYLAPVLLGAGGLTLVSAAPLQVGRGLLVAGTVALVALYVPLWRRQRDDAVLVQALGAVLAAGGALLWLGGLDVSRLLPWLAAFLVLTIGGERLELARLAMGPRAGPTLVALSSALAGAVVATLVAPRVGHPLLGVAVLALGGWLAAHDVARRTVRSSGLPRFLAAGMLGGYLWLGVAGSVWALGGAAYDGPRYDAVVHAVFLGFTLSMVMAHAPVILPAVLRRPLPYHPGLWAPLTLLHVSLLLRVWLGDGLGLAGVWQVAGVLNVVSLLLFVVVAAWSATRRPAVRKATR
jgi:hypothetical protein